MDKRSSQETRECLLCLRIPIERIRKTVEDIFRRWFWQSPDEYDQAVVDGISERAAKLIVSAYEKDRIALCGKSPTGLMAAAIYLSGIMEEGVKISQEMVARALNITSRTISFRAQQINDLLELGIMEKRLLQERRKQYVCPFCENIFTYLGDLSHHLYEGGRFNSSILLVRMFNIDGIMVDMGALEKLKRYSGTCERPPAVKPRPRWRDWRESPVVGTYIVTERAS